MNIAENADLEGRPKAPDHTSHPTVFFEVDCERIEVHTDHLTVREILDLVDADPSQHYIVELGERENIPHTDHDESIPLHECAKFITVFTGETPVS